MDPSDIAALISNIGFPVACVIVMFSMWNKERLDHKEEVKQMTEAVNNNTVVLKQILTKMGADDYGN
jgi:hypothetical protein